MDAELSMVIPAVSGMEEMHASRMPAIQVPSVAPKLPEGLGPRAIRQWNVTQRLTPEEWHNLLHKLPGRIGARARHGGNAKRFIEAVLWVAQTGAYWSDLPRGFGSWHGIYVRFIRWSQDGNWSEVLACLDIEDARRSDLQALVDRYLARNNTKHLSRAMRAS